MSLFCHYKKNLFIFIFLIIFAFASFAQSAVKRYQIVNVKYDITPASGVAFIKPVTTRESAMQEMCPVDTKTVFKNQKEFDEYLRGVRNNLANQRVFKEAELLVAYGAQDTKTGIIPVTLTFRTVDGWNVIAVPYPSINSNSGIQARVKYRDYNFLGSMKMFDLNLTYHYNTAENPTKQLIGANTSFVLPVRIAGYELGWSNSFDVSKTFIKGVPLSQIKPYFSYATGIGLTQMVDDKSWLNYSLSGAFTHETDGNLYYNAGTNISYGRSLTRRMSLGLSMGQTYFHSPKYPDDKNYMNTSFGISLPFNIGTIPDFASVSWTPSVSFSWNWDTDALRQNPLAPGKKTDQIEHTDLKGPVITFGHSIGAGSITYVGNFREGFSFSLAQSWGYNLHTKAMPMPTFTLNTQLHLQNGRIGFYNRNFWYFNLGGGTTTFAERMRGLRDYSEFYSSNILVMNFDFPFQLIKTNWVAWGFPEKLFRHLDFEMHVVPFIDVALGHNPYTNTNFLIADGYYTGGMEVLVYLNKIKSVTIRGMLGIDLARTILPGRLVNKDWRPGFSKFEYSFGVGTFY